MKRDVITSPGAPAPMAHYCQGVLAGDTLYAAGQIASDYKTGVAPDARQDPAFPYYGSDIQKQARYILQNLRSVFEAAGSSLADVVKSQVFMSLGDDGRLLREVPALGYRGVVIEGMGAGHVPAPIAPIVSDLVQSLAVVLASRVHTGPTFTSTYGFAGSETDLLRRGAVAAGDLSGLKARLLLSLLLRGNADRDAIARAFAAYR